MAEAQDPDSPLELELKPGLDPREIGQLLRRARLRAGLTQSEVGRRMGVVQNTIARLEAGKSPPTLATLSKFARAAGYRARFCLEAGVTEASEAPRKVRKPAPQRRAP